LHISKIRFLFPVSFTIEYKIFVAEFYQYVRLGADLLKNVVTRAWKLQNGNAHTSKIGKLLPVCLSSHRRRIDHICEPHAKFCANQ